MAAKKKPSVQRLVGDGVQSALEATKAQGLIGEATTVVVPIVVVINGIVNFQREMEFEAGDTE